MKPKMKPHKMPGLLITFCGLDGSGKTTIISLMRNYFIEHGIRVQTIKQPTDAVRNSDIFRNYTDCPEHDEYDYRSLSLLAASDRVQQSNKIILPLLKNGDTVLCDRYYYSCLANLRARGFIHDKWIYEVAAFIPKPDFAFFLDVDVKTAIMRVRSREEEKDRYIDIPLQYRLQNQYRLICKQFDGIQIDSSHHIEKTFQSILNKIILDEGCSSFGR